MKKIIFICTQNVFRSYSAEVLAKKYIKENNLNILVDSAGTHAYDWERPYSYTFDKLEELGVEVNFNHKNKKITKKLCDQNDIIICMTKSHKYFVEQNFGVKAYLFNELARGEITDLQDDNENNEYTSLENFVKDIVVYIYDNIPFLLENVNDNF